MRDGYLRWTSGAVGKRAGAALVIVMLMTLVGGVGTGYAASLHTSRVSSASHGWTVRATSTPLLEHNGSIVAAVCTSATACTAVGSYTDRAGATLTLAEVWNGTSWKVQATPDPSAAFGSYLTGVACSSSTACTAVGYSYTSAAGQVTLAERWNGKTWAIQSTPNPAGPAAALDGVACPSSTACTAVGSSFDSSDAMYTLAMRWNGTSWTIQSTPSPGVAVGNSLYGVACTSPTTCTAVGTYYGGISVGDVALAERWDGVSWTVQSTPEPAGATDSELLGVACTAATACTAVGEFDNSSYVPMTLAERWNGASWIVQSTPNQTGATYSVLFGVDCTAATSCTAVGTYTAKSHATLTLAEQWDGTSWTVQSTPNPARGTLVGLDQVTCNSATVCTAVGDYTATSGKRETVAERWNGTSWTIQSTSNQAGTTESGLTAVTCTSATACTAVGSYTNSSNKTVTLAERWHGKSWKIESTPNSAGATQSQLTGAACTSATRCIAVGSYVAKSGKRNTLAERWNGRSWTIERTPNPAASSGSQLSGVACTSAAACIAVGGYFNKSGIGVTLAERWNGKSWKVQSTPKTPGAPYGVLSGVACTSATACTAVGDYTNRSAIEFTLAERWNGKSWKVESTPKPAGAFGSGLSDVACTSASRCTSVGAYTNRSGRGVTLAERWNGKSWKVQSTPNPAGAFEISLAAVTCTSASACTAVGTYTASSSKGVTLAERWNGKSWKIQSSPNLAGALLSQLAGVACTSATTCIAVGTGGPQVGGGGAPGAGGGCLPQLLVETEKK